MQSRGQVCFHSRNSGLEDARRALPGRVPVTRKAIHLESFRMVSRALSLATVMLLIGCFGAEQAEAQNQNLEAGKRPSQIFAGACSACHKSPRGLLKTVAAGSLPGFLRQHYTTGPEMSAAMAAYLVSAGSGPASTT